MQVWRLCKQKHQETAFSGEGGLYASGRWHLLQIVKNSDRVFSLSKKQGRDRQMITILKELLGGKLYF
jgi:RES domain-containing protein